LIGQAVVRPLLTATQREEARRVPIPGTRPDKSEVDLCDGHRGRSTSNTFRKRDPGRHSAKETEHTEGHHVRPG
jgi:hypothetical protein